MNTLCRLGSIALSLGLAACASEPVHYHTLLAPSANTAALSPPADFLIEVLPVGIPSNLDQAQLVVRQGVSGLTVLDSERWASPLSDEVHDALSAELSQRLATQNVAGLPQPAGRPVLRIKLQVRRFDAWPGQRVQLDADWTLGFADDTTNNRLLCRGRFEQPANGGYPEMVAAQQRAIAALAARIDADARQLAQSRSLACAQGSQDHRASGA